MSEEQIFMEAAKKGMLCELDLKTGDYVTVEPYAIYTGGKKRRCWTYFQTGRAGSSADQGWREIESFQVRGAKVLNKPYTIRKDYNPMDKVKYVMMHFSVPNIEGKERPVDLAPAWDKSVHNRPAGAS